MEEMMTLKIPKKDVDAFLRVVKDIEFIKEAEEGNKEVSSGKFKTLQQLKHKYQS